MCNRLKRLNKLQQSLGKIIKALIEIYKIAKEEKDKELKNILVKFVFEYNKLNSNFCEQVTKRIPESYKKDIVDVKFNNIVKDIKINDE